MLSVEGYRYLCRDFLTIFNSYYIVLDVVLRSEHYFWEIIQYIFWKYRFITGSQYTSHNHEIDDRIDNTELCLKLMGENYIRAISIQTFSDA